MTVDRAAIEAAILEQDSTSKGIKKLELVLDDFLGGSVHYLEYLSDETSKSDAFFYAYTTKDGEVKLYDDGIEAIARLKDVLDRRRSLLQRLSEFTLVELIGAMIALSVTVSFVWLSVRGGQVSGQTGDLNRGLNRDFIGIFGIIVGYYFGKNTTGSR
ncbi:MAG TPA: hypothetical protein VHG32_13700 [Thermoanaerobaculia bacterium]|jgi:hypothetical protein|nr:hypothetical protein [Thermoanaerobaculia bacterium]